MNDNNHDPEVLDADSVSQFLINNKHFLLEHPDVLTAIELHHDSGRAVSLIERQVHALREKHAQSEAKLTTLLNNARTNDQLLEKTQRLVLAVVEAHDTGDIIDALFYALNKEFAIQHVRLVLTEPQTQVNNVRITSQSEISKYLETHFAQNKTVFSGLKAEQIAYFFESDNKDIGSAAIGLLRRGSEIQGVLAIGHADSGHYQHTSGTLFLQHICDVITRALDKASAN